MNITLGIVEKNSVIICPEMLGKICLNIILNVVAPCIFAYTIKSWLIYCSIRDLTWRALFIHDEIDIESSKVAVLLPKKRCFV